MIISYRSCMRPRVLTVQALARHPAVNHSFQTAPCSILSLIPLPTPVSCRVRLHQTLCENLYRLSARVMFQFRSVPSLSHSNIRSSFTHRVSSSNARSLHSLLTNVFLADWASPPGQGNLSRRSSTYPVRGRSDHKREDLIIRPLTYQCTIV